MTSLTLTVPDLGDIVQAEIIEILVKVGDILVQDQVVMTLESDKALLEVPTNFAGRIAEIIVTPGQAVKSGDVLMRIMSDDDMTSQKNDTPQSVVSKTTKPEAPKATVEPLVNDKIVKDARGEPVKSSTAVQANTPEAMVRVPDLGDIASADVVDIVVKVDDEVALEQTVITLESDKALVEVPASVAGRVIGIDVKQGQSLKTGDVILRVATSAPLQNAMPSSPQAVSQHSTMTMNTESVMVDKPAVLVNITAPNPAQPSTVQPSTVQPSTVQPSTAQLNTEKSRSDLSNSDVYAGPAVRRLANQLGVVLTQVIASGPRGRLLKEDVHSYVKQQLQSPAKPAVATAVVDELPTIDFSQWGKIEAVRLNGIQKKSAQNLTRAWQMIPHVTQFDLADITDLEAFRKSEAQAKNIKLTMLAFLVKASGYALQQFPKFKSSLQNDGSTLVMKQYCHIGVAVDTPNGLLVPVIRDVDQKSVLTIAQDIVTSSDKAKQKQLTGNDMKGGCFTISSLGGIGGTGFTPIVNWPEVAILGVSRSSLQPQWQGNAFVPRLMLPLSLSYDHRVIDGADAARFTRYLAELLADIRRVLL